MFNVAVVEYEKPYDSLKKAIDLCNGFEKLTKDSKVFIKPNLVVWHKGVDFPKYGVLTTARLIKDCVMLLKEYGVQDITIGEGAVEIEKKSESIVDLAAKGMGFEILAERYGVKIVDVLKGSFVKVTVDDITLSVNEDVMKADFFIDMPVLKTHSQAKVSLGIKNLKGLININSRKKCHNADPINNLDYHMSKFPDMVSPSLTITDGIYTLERGPLYNGIAHRSNIIIASKDLISADLVGSTILGIDPADIPYLKQVAVRRGRKCDLSDIKILGGIDIRNVLQPHRWEFPQGKSGSLPVSFERAGIKGIRFPEQDKTICTYCSIFINYVVMGILMAKNKDKSFNDIEILDGKIQEPTGKHKHTILVGQCQVNKNGKNPLINHCVKIKGCPPKKENFLKAYKEAGIELPDNFIEWMDRSPEILHMKKYIDKSEFDPSFYNIG